MKRRLDRTDVAIVQALAKNARLSNKELAAHVKLAPSSCHDRVRRLTEEGVLRGFHAEIDRKALGIGIEAIVTLRLRRHSDKLYAALRAHVLSLPEVLELFHVSGSDDFLVHVAVRDTEHLRDLNLKAFASRTEVGHISTALLFEHVRSPAPPSFVTDE